MSHVSNGFTITFGGDAPFDIYIDKMRYEIE
jgi:hypothetical protein